MALELNAATRKALKAAADKEGYLKDYLVKNKTAVELASVIVDCFFADEAEAPKVKITKAQLEKFFTVEEAKAKRGRKAKAE